MLRLDRKAILDAVTSVCFFSAFCLSNIIAFVGRVHSALSQIMTHVGCVDCLAQVYVPIINLKRKCAQLAQVVQCCKNGRAWVRPRQTFTGFLVFYGFLESLRVFSVQGCVDLCKLG